MSSPQPLLPGDHPRRADLAASVQAAIVDSLVSQVAGGATTDGTRQIVVAGGGANARLREARRPARPESALVLPADRALHRQRRDDCPCRRTAARRSSAQLCNQRTATLAADGVVAAPAL